ncbi:AlwI family type II restriction endonuclease [Clostridium botulinum]|nr:AlwI family type II restriction endonuclease [Clostridium botulinum]
MAKIWSISTTIRNPKRIPLFLEVAADFKGIEWNKETQKSYQILLISRKIYKPKKYKKYIENNDITFEIAKKIFEDVGYKDPPMRGRQSMNLLKKMGLIDFNEYNQIVITSIGKDLRNGKITLGDALLNINFDSICNIDVNPIIITLQFLLTLTKKQNMMLTGISIEELKYYVMTIQDWRNCEMNVDKLIKGRKKKEFHLQHKKYVEEHYTNFKHINDYTDSIIRYFNMSNLLMLKYDNININVEKIDEIIDSIKKYRKMKKSQISELLKIAKQQGYIE